MKESLLLRNFDNSINSTPAQVIPLWSVIKESASQRKETPRLKVVKKIPLFYNEPVFKSKKHDFL